MADALPTKLPPAFYRKDVQRIAGALLLGLAAGLYIGIKLARPVQWVPPETDRSTPCSDCEERLASAESNGHFEPLTPDERRQVIEAVAQIEADKAAAVASEAKVPADG
jgi:hypothetical protein